MPNFRVLPVILLCLTLTACAEMRGLVSPAVSYAADAPPENADAPGVPEADAPKASAKEKPAALKASDRIPRLRQEKDTIEGQVSAADEKLKNIQTQNETNFQDYDRLLASLDKYTKNSKKPDLNIVQQIKIARAKLEEMSRSTSALGTLSSDVSAAGSAAKQLHGAIRETFTQVDASYDDHVALTLLEEDVNRLLESIQRQTAAIGQDPAKYASAIKDRQRRLDEVNALINKEGLYAQNIDSKEIFPKAALQKPQPPSPVEPMKAFNSTKPLMIIRFDRENIDYKEALSKAISEALKRYLNVSFELMSVSPQGKEPVQSSSGGSDILQNAQKVAEQMKQLGVLPERIALTQTSNSAAVNAEVQIFLR